MANVGGSTHLWRVAEAAQLLGISESNLRHTRTARSDILVVVADLRWRSRPPQEILRQPPSTAAAIRFVTCGCAGWDGHGVSAVNSAAAS